MSLQGTLFKDCYGEVHFNVDNAMGHVAFDRKDYDKEADMWVAIGNFIRILSDAGYHVIAGWDDKGCGIFVIQYADVKSDWSEYRIEVLDADEYDSVRYFRDRKLAALMAHNDEDEDFPSPYTNEG